MTSTCFMMHLGSYGYFDFDQNSPSCPWPLHTKLTVTLHLQYHRHPKSQNNKT